MTTRRVERVCVIGTGLAGLACAVAAASRGLQVALYDQADRQPVLPAHVEVVPNMLRDLVAIGVGDACVRAGFPYHGIDVVDRQGRQLFQLPTEGLAGPRYPAALGIAHAELHRVLERAALERGASLARGARVVSVSTQDSRAYVELANGERTQADLIVLATGAGSALRSAVFPQATATKDFGQVWWYTLVQRPIDLDRPLVALGGAGQRAVLVPVRNDTAGLALTRPAHGDTPALPAVQLRECLMSFAPRVRALARYIADDAPVAQRPVRPGLLEGPWHQGAVLAVGDCAHALPPHFGQAAAQAIEDALVLGELLAEASDRAALLAHFQSRRAPRARRVHELTMTAARWDLEPEGAADLSLLLGELSRTVALPA